MADYAEVGYDDYGEDYDDYGEDYDYGSAYDAYGDAYPLGASSYEFSGGLSSRGGRGRGRGRGGRRGRRGGSYERDGGYYGRGDGRRRSDVKGSRRGLQGADARRQAAAKRRQDKWGGRVAGARESSWAKGHESAKATFLNGLTPGEMIKSNGYPAQVVAVLSDHSGGLPKVEVTYPTEPDYGSEVVLGSSIEYAPYAMTLSDVTVGQFAVSKPNKEAIMKIFKFLDKDGSGSLDFSDFEQVRSTRSGEWLQELAKMDTNGDGVTDPTEFIAFFKSRAAAFAAPRPPIYARTLKELAAQLEQHFNVALERVIAEAIAFFDVRIPDFQALWAACGVPPVALDQGF